MVKLVACLGMLLFFGCENQSNTKKSTPIKQWQFVKEIPLKDIAPIGIAAQGNFLWLSDVANNRVVKINLEGKIISQFTGFERPMHIAIQGDKIYIPTYTTDSVKILENGNISNYIIHQQPDAVSGVAVNGNTVAITDFYNNRIILQQGDKTSIIGKKGHGDGELYYPTDVAIYNKLIYVADAYNNRVQVFNFNGKYVKMIAWNEHINVASGLKVTANQIIVTDFEGNRVLIYNHKGNLLQILSTQFNHPTDVEVVDNKMYVVNYKGKNISLYQIALK